MLIRWTTNSCKFLFCKFKYYKDLANEINYTLPNINQELGYAQSDKLWLLGYRIKNPIIANNNQTNQVILNQSKQESKNSQILLQSDPFGREYLKYQDIRKFAQNNDMDVCQADKQAKQVSLVKIRQAVYRKFYQTRIYKANSTGKKYKQTRIPQNISDHDIRNKVENIKSLIKKGEHNFKIYTQNDSKKSQQALKKFCKYLGRNPILKIQQYEVQQKTKRRPGLIIQRWAVNINFSEQSKVNYEQINKKWKRHLINKKLENQKKQKPEIKLFEGLQNQAIEIQRQVIKQMRDLKVPLPKNYREYQELENGLQASGKNFFMDFAAHSLKQMIKNNQSYKTSKRNKNLQIKQKKKNQEDDQNQLFQEDEDQQEQKANIHHSKLKQTLKNMKISQQQVQGMKKQMNMRTVDQILQQIEQLKGEKIQLDVFEVQKLKILQLQLKQTLKLAGIKQKV